MFTMSPPEHLLIEEWAKWGTNERDEITIAGPTTTETGERPPMRDEITMAGPTTTETGERPTALSPYL